MSTPADIIGNVFSSGGGGGGGDAIGIIILVLIALFFFAGLGMFIGYVMWRMKFKHKTIIFEKHSGGVRIVQDWAKLIKTKGMTKLDLLKGKAKVQPPPNYETKYFWGKNQAFMLHKENEMYRFHINYEVNSKELKVLPQEVTEFIVKEIEENKQRYGVKEFWEEYGTLITSAGFSLLVFGMMLILIQKFGDLTGQINSIASRVGEMLASAQGTAPK